MIRSQTLYPTELRAHPLAAILYRRSEKSATPILPTVPKMVPKFEFSYVCLSETIEHWPLRGVPSGRNSQRWRMVHTNHRIEESTCIWSLPALLSSSDRRTLRCASGNAQLEHDTIGAADFESRRAGNGFQDKAKLPTALTKSAQTGEVPSHRMQDNVDLVAQITVRDPHDTWGKWGTTKVAVLP